MFLVKNKQVLLGGIFFFILYTLFPSNNPVIDSLCYAGDVKHNLQLFYPHHLLYNFYAWSMLQIAKSAGFEFDVLRFLIRLNGLLSVAILGVFYLLLLKINVSEKRALLFSCLLGVSFSFIRFATDNETYIVPFFFSLLGTYYWYEWLNFEQKKYMFFAGLYCSIACLFHQIHFWWWLGLFIGVVFYKKTNNYQSILIYFSSALLVPFTYLLVLYHLRNTISFNSFIQFVFHDFYSGSAQSHSISFSHFALTFINFFRSWIQVHGSMGVLLKKSSLWLVPAMLSIVILGSQYKQLFKFESFKINYFDKVIILITFLHLGFAFYSVGNAEFMLMIPALLILLLATKWKGSVLTLFCIMLSLGIWNISYHLLPTHFFKHTEAAYIATKIEKNPTSFWILNNSADVEMIHQYKNGSIGNNTITNPAGMVFRNHSTKKLELKIDSCFKNKISLFTNSLNVLPVNRGNLFVNNTDSLFFKNYHLVLIDSCTDFWGNYYFHQVISRK